MLHGRQGSHGNTAGVPLYIYITNLLEKALFLQKHMIITTGK